MRLLLFGSLVFIFAALPVFLLESYVMPQLDQLEETYAGFDGIANDIAEGKDVEAPQINTEIISLN